MQAWQKVYFRTPRRRQEFITSPFLFLESYLGQPVKNAVITVPAYFNDSQRQVKTIRKFKFFLTDKISLCLMLVSKLHVSIDYLGEIVFIFLFTLFTVVCIILNHISNYNCFLPVPYETTVN